MGDAKTITDNAHRGLRLAGGNPDAPRHKNWRATLCVCLHCLEVTALVYPVMWRHLAESEPCPKCGGWLVKGAG